MLPCTGDLQQNNQCVVYIDANAVFVELGKLSLNSVGTAITDIANCVTYLDNYQPFAHFIISLTPYGIYSLENGNLKND